MDTYHVGITMHNSFYIDASSPEEAQQKVRDMEAVDLLFDVDFNITYTDIDNSYLYIGKTQNELRELVASLTGEYDTMTDEGRKTLNKIADKLGM